MARRTGSSREKDGADVDLPTLREEIRTQGRIKSVRGYVRVVRAASTEEMTFTTIDGLAALLQQLTEDADG